jgi:hypothetical protein
LIPVSDRGFPPHHTQTDSQAHSAFFPKGPSLGVKVAGCNGTYTQLSIADVKVPLLPHKLPWLHSYFKIYVDKYANLTEVISAYTGLEISLSQEGGRLLCLQLHIYYYG